MKLNKKFPPELRSVMSQSFKDYSAWIGKKDIERCVCLTLNEAKILENFCWRYAALLSTEESTVHNKLFEQIKKVEGEQ